METSFSQWPSTPYIREFVETTLEKSYAEDSYKDIAFYRELIEPLGDDWTGDELLKDNLLRDNVMQLSVYLESSSVHHQVDSPAYTALGR